jgi:hypothetical protein
MTTDIEQLQTSVSANIPGLDDEDGEENDILRAYVRQLLVDYQLVPREIGDQAARGVVDQLVRARISGDKPKAWTWDDAYAIERALALIEPIERVRQRLLAARREYQELTGARTYEEYAAHAPPDLLKATDAEVRADLLQVLSESQWTYSTIGVQHHVRNRLARNLAIGSLFLVCVPAGLTIWQLFIKRGEFSIPNLVIVMLAGALGGLISTYRRLEQVPLDGNPAVNLVLLNRSAALIYLAPAFGAIFAAILYALLISGLLSGDLFPHIYTPQTPAPPLFTVPFKLFATDTGPIGGIDVAKLMVWSFIAGFAERLVPDTLDRIAASATKENGK